MVFHTFLKSTLHTHFKQALYTSTLSKHFIKALYTSTLSKHFIKALYTSTLSKHFIRVFLKHFRNTRQGITKVLREGITKVLRQGITKVLRQGITQVLRQGIKTRYYNKVLRQDSKQQSIKHLCTNLSVCFPCRLFFASLTVVDCIRWKGQGLHLSMEDVLIKCIAD